MTTYERTKEATETYLLSLLERRVQHAATIHPNYAFFWKTIHAIVAGGGKRVRPYLTMVGYGAYSDDIIPIAAAQELIHSAMLMHDDVIDRDTLRHGQKNMNGLYEDRYRQQAIGEADAIHYAHGASLLGGDALLSEAYLLLAEAPFPPAVTGWLVERLHTSIYEVLGGELLDVEAPLVADSQADPLTIYRYKTAGYSFIGPLLSGAHCADTEASILEALEHYGELVGVGFQLQDDLLGLFGDSKETGKSLLTDLKEAKRTFLIATHTAQMNTAQQQRFEQLFGNASASDQEFELLKQDIINSGAKTATEQLVTRYFTDAKAVLDSLPEGMRKQELLTFTEHLQTRSF